MGWCTYVWFLYCYFSKPDLAVGQVVEVLDRSCISRMRVAEVIKLVGGRIHARYWDSKAEPGKAGTIINERKIREPVFKLV